VYVGLFTHKALIALSDSFDLPFVADIPDGYKFLSFCIDVGRIAKNASRSIFNLDVRVHLASYKPIFFFNDEDILSPKRDEVTGDWRKLHNEELHNLYSSPNIIRMIKSRRMRWAEHVTRMGRPEMYIGYWWESQNERDH
jgi:hypothetical protein